MSGEIKKEIQLEIAHVLFMDIVGYSKRLINEQRGLLDTLNQIVRGTDEFRSADAAGRLIKIPTGDGMALVFYNSPEEPVECALDISRALKSQPNLPLRMGVHSGPVGGVIDVNERANVAGAGINMAQRVMDCGDAGHILLSKRVAEDLEQFEHWQPHLHDLGECEVKHGVRLHIANLYTEELGNPEPPEKFKHLRGKRKRGAAPSLSPARSSKFRWVLIGALVLFVGAFAAWLVYRQGQTTRESAEPRTEAAAITPETTKLRQGIIDYPQMEAQIRGARAEKNLVAEQSEQERIYAQLGQQLGIDPKVLREKLPRFADELKKARNVSTYERANASYIIKDYVDAESLALRAATETQEHHPIDSQRLINTLELAGLSAHRASEYDRAMLHFRKAEGLTDRNRNLEDWVRLQREIADLLVAQAKLGDAEKLFRSLIELRARVLGPEHPDTLERRHRMIYVLNRQTKFAEAETEARDVLRLREKTLGPEHIDTNLSRDYLADALMNRGKHAEAESLYHKIIPFFEKALGPEHPRTLSARLGLATALSDQGKHAEAEPLYREIIRLYEKVYGPVDPDTLAARQNLATSLQAQHKYSEAETEYRDAIKIMQSMLGPEHRDILISRNNLAELLDDLGKFAEAETECRQIIALEEITLGRENQLTLNSRGNLAVALIGLGRFADAEVEYKDVLKRMERVLGLEHPNTLAYTTKFVTGLARQKRAGEAMKIAREMEDHARKTLGPDSETTQTYAKLTKDSEAGK